MLYCRDPGPSVTNAYDTDILTWSEQPNVIEEIESVGRNERYRTDQAKTPGHVRNGGCGLRHSTAAAATRPIRANKVNLRG